MSKKPETREIIESKTEYAGFLKRFLAFFIDIVLLSFIS